jgi:rubrerythrin
MARTQVKTVGELFALALAMEQRAAARFRRLAGRMREDGRDDLADLFEGLAREEDAHAERLREGPREPDADVGALVRDFAPDLAEKVPAGDEPALRQLSVYHSLAEAVRNEVKAFEFYSHIAAAAEDAALQDLAENLAKEELDHANALRRVRRQAYHRLRPEAGPWPKASAVETLGDLRAAAARGEQAIAASRSPRPCLSSIDNSPSWRKSHGPSPIFWRRPRRSSTGPQTQYRATTAGERSTPQSDLAPGWTGTGWASP